MADERDEGPPPGRRPDTAAEAASRAARMADEAARLAEHEEAAAYFAGRVTQVGSAVAREYALPSILDVVLDQTLRTLEARCAHVYLADEGQRALTLVGHRGLPPDLVEKLSSQSFDASSLVARAASSRQTQVMFSDTNDGDPALRVTRELLSRVGCDSAVALPLLARDRLVGVLAFALAGAHEFTWEERSALTNCAEIFSFGIANAAIYEEERHLRALFEAVGQATVAIASELELTQILQHIVDEARVIVGAEYAALGIVVSPDRPFDPWVSSGMTQEQAEQIGSSLRRLEALGPVPSDGHILREADILRHPAFQGRPEDHRAITSVLGVPIRHQGQTICNLYLVNKRDGVAFTAEDERAIELLARQAGAAVYQAQLREELRRERARFRAIVKSASHGVLFVEAATMKLIANRRAIDLMGQQLPTETAETVEYRGELRTPDGRPVPEEALPAHRVMRGEIVLPHELLVRRPDGTEVPVLLSASPVVDGERPEGVVVVFEDITMLKELDRLREEWASIVTHDLRQPLNLMTMQVELLRLMAAKPNPQKLLEVAQQMQKAAATLSRMVGDLAEVSRIETKRLTLEREIVDVAMLAREVVERLRALRPDRRIELDAQGAIHSVNADPMRVCQVLENLITNALKYSDPATDVTVEVRQIEDEVRVSVTNRGAGISAEELPHIFDRYYRTLHARAGAAGGLGLGLYIAKGLIEAHGGRIWAESSPGEATAFHFALPVVNP